MNPVSFPAKPSFDGPTNFKSMTELYQSLQEHLKLANNRPQYRMLGIYVVKNQAGTGCFLYCFKMFCHVKKIADLQETNWSIVYIAMKNAAPTNGNLRRKNFLEFQQDD